MTQTPTATTQVASRSRIAKYAVVLGALTAVTPLTIDMYLPALPQIAEQFHASESAVQLTITGTLLGVAVGQLIAGPLADRLGRRRPLIAGMLLHLVASVLCAVAPTIELLLTFRTLQGFGASAGTVIALAIVRDLFTGLPAARLLARLSLVTGAAPILAPTLGSLILRGTTWNGLFVALALLAAVLAAIAAWVLPETLPPARRQTGGLKTSFRTYGRLVRERQFMGLTLVTGFVMTIILGYVSGASFVMQTEHGLSTSTFGLVFGVNSIGLIAMGQLNPWLLRRYSGVRLLQAGLIFAVAASAVLVAMVATGTGGLWGLLVPLFVVISTAGMVMPNLPGLALARHGDVAGTAAAVLGAVQFGVGASLAPLVGLGGSITGLSMSLVIAGAAVAALLTLQVVVRPTSVEISDDNSVIIVH